MSTRGALRAAVFGVLAATVLAACTSTPNGDDNGGDVVVIPTVTQAAPTGSSAPARESDAPPADESDAPPARPVSTPCTRNAHGQLVFVSLRRQHLWMCAAHRVVHDTAITSGMLGQYTETPTGSYRIQGLNRNSVLTLNTGATYPVKYWIPFDAPLFGFHDSPWQRFPYGSDRYKTRGSHGCVHMPLPAIRFLYRWADIGTRVRIKA
jgi:hypothetical protein